MSENTQAARELALRAVELAFAAGAHEAEAVSSAGTSALTRFAGNRIHQNVAEKDASVSVRAVVGTKVGVAATNHTDDDALRACCEAAVAAANSAPEDPSFPGLPAAMPVESIDRTAETTRQFGAEARAQAVASIVAQSSSRGLTAAGGVKVSDESVAVANTHGVDVAQAVTGLRATVLSMSKTGGSGWASFVSRDASELAASALGEEAASLAERSEGAVDLEPGEYTVVLAPEAVADIVEFLGYLSFGAKSVAEERSFMSTRLGEQVASPLISIADDALSPLANGLAFDFEGQPKTRVALIEKGVATEYVTDSYWAARLGRPNTGHALPAPNSYGPMPLNMEMAAGDATLEELIAGVRHGVYVTRFHYVNVEDPVPATLTGMTRDGTFLIRDGRLSSPLKNQRFTQSAVEALSRVQGVTRERRYIGTETSPVLVPGLLVAGFRLTGQTQ
ncbi:MAG: TldD/PmbA family protein [Actinobacteria bacterium]|nr:TldD/PmbA family protein [Actinomycetota bacterium]MCG2807256.1 TldD/PmbA family protein [Coriobacteriia bacterium]